MTALTRRGFLRLLPVAAIGASLWRPRHRRPRVESWCYADGMPVSPQIAELNRVTMQEIMPAVRDDFFKSEPLMAYLRRHETDGR